MSRKQSFSLLSAIFLLVVLSLVGTYVVSIAAMGRNIDLLALQSVRAYFAARSGIEWGLFQVTNNLVCFVPTNLDLTQGGAVGFQVNVSCSSSAYTEGTTTYNIFTINAVATQGSFGDVDYVARQLQVKATL